MKKLLALLIIMSGCSYAQEEYEAIDLGLSVKWAVHNIGAKTASDYGTYLAWGEMEEKTTYWWDNYKYSDSTECEQCVIDLGESICGTEYDMARQLWKGDWRLPTDKEILELRNQCSWEWTQLNGVNGFKVTGPNGNSIFLPAGGCFFYNKKEDVGVQCSYWGGTKSFIRNAHTIMAFVDEDDGTIIVKCWGDSRPIGRLVRPVK
jgi:hypothetical protein